MPELTGSKCIVDDMGIFRIDIEIESPITGARRRVNSALVATGAELSWIPGEALEELAIERRKVRHFRQADGTVLERWAGDWWTLGLRRRRRRSAPPEDRPTRS